jgi:hypothetical protein
MLTYADLHKDVFDALLSAVVVADAEALAQDD